MDILQIVGLGVVATILIAVIKTQRPEIALQVSIIVGIIIFLMVASKLTGIIELINSYSQKVNIDMIYPPYFRFAIWYIV